MIPPTTAQTQSLHTLWMSLAKQTQPYSWTCHFRWETWLGHGWTEADLKLVVDYIWKRVKAGKRERESFKLSNLLEPDRFSEDLSMAKSEARKPVVAPDKKRVMLASGRAENAPQAKPEAIAVVVQRCLQQIRKEIE